jgi:hypothetical protein
MGVNISPDGLRYLAMANGERMPMPFHVRWLLPVVLGANTRNWRIASMAGWLTFVLGIGFMGGWPAGLLVAALSGPALAFKLPVLVDGVALGVTAIVAAQTNTTAMIVLAILAGCISERAPIFAALWIWSPWPLVGLLSPFIRWAFWKSGPDVKQLEGTLASDVLQRPWRIAAWRNWRDINLVAPWGGLLAGLLYLDAQMAAVLGVAYAQLIIATDSIRLYQWAAPVLAIAIATQLDWRVVVALAVVTWFNPLRGDGI